MKKLLAIQMDAVETINPRTDTTMLLGLEALERGYEVYCYQPKNLTFLNGEITARARKVIFHRNPDKHFTAGEWQIINLRETDVVLMRQDPPFNMEYITATHLLEMLQPDVLVVNDPFHVRNAPEKMFLFHFPEFAAPTLISRDMEAIENFFSKHTDIVLKPLYGYAGQSVFRIRQGDSNFHALLEMFFGSSPEPIIAQRFIPEIKTMDKRILVINGEVTAVYGRVPAKDDIRANMRAGGMGVKTEATKRDLQIGETVGKELVKRGILLAGLDVIGEYLTEINVTCPTGLVISNALYGLKQEATFWDAVERKLKKRS